MLDVFFRHGGVGVRVLRRMVRAKRTRETGVFVEAEKGEGVCGVWRSGRVGECVWRGVMKNGKEAASGSTRRGVQAGLTRQRAVD